MDYEEIKILIDKYWRCESTLEEEKMLRDYFLKEHVPSELIPYAGLFKYYGSVSGLETKKIFSPHFGGRQAEVLQPVKTRNIRLAWYYRVAAAVLLILVLFVINEQVGKIKQESVAIVKDTFQDPEEALAETKRILFMVSHELYKVEREASRFAEFSKAEEKFRKTKTKDK
ncbi:MAG TPA: hypothetical protein VI583_04185 [Cyclobacteriaceae bacterium]|nr:hypothetical protein [Cyclobacteriaceae bacterium]